MKLLADEALKDFFGKITPPPGTPVGAMTDPQTALVKMINVGMTIFLIVAALYTFLNLVLAGFMYVTSSGDAKKVSEANARITYTVIGLGIIVAAPLIAIVIGIVIFGRWDAILNPDIQTIK